MLNIRKMCEADLEETAAIEAKNFSRPWKISGFRDALLSDRALYLVAEEEGRILGYAGMWMVLDEGEITNVSVNPEDQGHHIGRALMEALLKEGEEAQIASYFLEVRQNNQPARSLYTSLGFEETGVRKNFYEDPVEDGIVMCKR